MNTLGVILARAGSVGLPGKHVRSLMGRPVIAYTFEHARGCRRLTHIAVSTDCPQVMRLAQAAGLDVIERPASLATSEASVQDAALHALDAMGAAHGVVADAVAILYGNIPIRGADVTDQAIDKLCQTGCDSVRSFCPVGKWHPAWMNRLDGDRVSQLQPNSIHRRQDLEPLFLHDGAALVVSRASLLRGRRQPDNPHAFFGLDRRGIETGIGQTIEIDHERDLYWAEAVLRERRSAEMRAALLRVAS